MECTLECLIENDEVNKPRFGEEEPWKQWLFGV